MSSDEQIYLMGGFDVQGVAQSECKRYDTKKNDWQWIASLNEARANASSWIVKDKLVYLLGGTVG